MDIINNNIKEWCIIKDELLDITHFDETFLREDLFQAKKNDYIIDVGWYEGINKFMIILVKKLDWKNPIVQIQCDSYKEILLGINLCIKYTEEILYNNANQGLKD